MPACFAARTTFCERGGVTLRTVTLAPNWLASASPCSTPFSANSETSVVFNICMYITFYTENHRDACRPYARLKVLALTHIKDRNTIFPQPLPPSNRVQDAVRRRMSGISGVPTQLSGIRFATL